MDHPDLQGPSAAAERASNPVHSSMEPLNMKHNLIGLKHYIKKTAGADQNLYALMAKQQKEKGDEKYQTASNTYQRSSIALNKNNNSTKASCMNKSASTQ